MITKKNGIKFAVLILIIAGAILIVNMYDLTRYANPETIKETVQSFGIFAPIIYIGMYVLSTIFFLPGLPFTIAGGIIFGSFLGTIYTLLGATIGASIAFVIARYLGESFIKNLLKDKFKKLSEYDEKLEQNGLGVILFLRLMPIFPFNGLNFALGLTKVRFRDYLVGSFIGMMPGVLVFTYFGDSLGSLNFTNIVISIILVLLLIGLFPLYNKYKKKKEQKDTRREVDSHRT